MNSSSHNGLNDSLMDRSDLSAAFTSVSLDAVNLSYYSKESYADRMRERVGLSADENKHCGSLQRVNFHADSCQVTALMGPHDEDRTALVELLGEVRKHGVVDGKVVINGLGGSTASYGDNIAYVPKKTLYLPGLTYYESLMYSARLRDTGANTLWGDAGDDVEHTYMLEKRVNEVLSIMELSKIKHRLIDERPVLRGELGGDLRRLSIAMEIVALPPVIVLEDPLYGMDPGVSVKVFACLKKLSRRGHVVVCSLVKPLPQIFEAVDSLVLLSNGRSIYSGEIKYLESFFCSTAIGYKRKKATDMVDFLMDIALGIERPQTQREALSSIELQDLNEKSNAFVKPSSSRDYLIANDTKSLLYYGLKYRFSWSEVFLHTFTILSRSLHIKFHEYDVIKKSIGASVLLALFIGLLDRNDGDFGYYCLSLFGLPYANASNVSACLFFSCSVLFVQQVLNIHIICQKLQVFRYEQRVTVAPALSFFLATYLSELPFTALYAMIFSNITYFLVVLNKGYDNYYFFIGVVLLTSVVALTAALLFASVLRKEIFVRDMFLLCTFCMIVLSGFPFQFSGLNNNFEKVAQINPLRWTFESLMVWKFSHYADGPQFLTPYDFQDFDKYHVFPILAKFVIVSGAFFLLSLVPPLKFLERATEETRARRNTGRKERLSSLDSADADGGDMFNDTPLPRAVTMAIKPIIFARESSITSKSQLSISMSQTGEHNTEHGPTVTLEDVGYRIKDITSPLGERTLLQNVCGQFDWGKLSMIMGSSGAGKSTLLHVIGGDIGYANSASGNVLFNQESVPDTVLPWQRCAFVEATDEHFRDLTVLQTVTYAMKLRCLSMKNVEVVEENVIRTLELLELTEVKDMKTKELSAGNLRRLSIAEEIVHGPQLLLIDEPTTGLDIRDISTMLMMFREMVNQDKTVIATMHQPSAAAFKVFDTLMLLSRGRVIYHGTVENAQSFFVTSPYAFKEEGYENPADYLLDISAGILKDWNGNIIGSLELNNYFESTTLFTYKRPLSNLRGVSHDSGIETSYGYSGSSNANPLNKDVLMEAESYNTPDNKPARTRVDTDMMLKESEFALNHGLIGKIRRSLSIDRESVVGADDSKKTTPSLMSCVGMLLAAYVTSVMEIDWRLYMWQLYVLTERSTYGLLRRQKTIIGGLILYVALAALLGFMLGNTSRVNSYTMIEINGQEKPKANTTYQYNTTAFFTLSLLLLSLANIQLIYYWMKVNEVFYKEHSRGLYSSVQQWWSASPALYFVRIVNTCIYGLIAYDMLVLRNNAEIKWFYFLSLNVAVVAATMLCEAAAIIAPDIRAAYQLIPAILFFNFAFSGIFVKNPTLPDGAGWLPSISLFRWVVQAQVINLFDNDSTLICVELFHFCLYDSFVALFGWENESKWYCFWIIVWNLVIYRGFILIALLIRTLTQKGRRQFRKGEDELDRLY